MKKVFLILALSIALPARISAAERNVISRQIGGIIKDLKTVYRGKDKQDVRAAQWRLGKKIGAVALLLSAAVVYTKRGAIKEWLKTSKKKKPDNEGETGKKLDNEGEEKKHKGEKGKKPILEVAYDESGETPLTKLLVEGIIQNNESKINELLKDNPGLVNIQNKNGEYPLFRLLQATRGYPAGALKILLRYEPDLSIIDKEGNTLLKVLVSEDVIDKEIDFEDWSTIIPKLTSSINVPNQSGETILMQAAREGQTDIIEWLLQKGAKSEAMNNGKNFADFAEGETLLYLLGKNYYPNAFAYFKNLPQDMKNIIISKLVNIPIGEREAAHQESNLEKYFGEENATKILQAKKKN